MQKSRQKESHVMQKTKQKELTRNSGQENQSKFDLVSAMRERGEQAMLQLPHVVVMSLLLLLLLLFFLVVYLKHKM